MLENIFVAVMCILALGIGIWTWWYENYKPADGETLTESMNDNEEIE